MNTHIDSIPIQIDSVKGTGLEDLTRCVYFSIECSLPSPNWTLTLVAASIPFMMLGLSGVIKGPIDGGYFETPEQIDALVKRVEKSGDLMVDTQELWVPNVFFRSMPFRGQVHRLSPGGFNEGIALTAGIYAPQDIRKRRREEDSEPEMASYSEVETATFRAWEDLVIERAKEQYPKNENYKLSIKDDDDYTDPPPWGALLPPNPPAGGGLGQMIDTFTVGQSEYATKQQNAYMR